MLKSQHQHATAAGFLIDVLVVIVQQNQIIERLEDIITEPSRTADIEQKVQLGAHGPRQLIIGVL